MTLVLGISHIIVALVIIGVSVPLMMKRIPMNRAYGVRIPIAFESDENWYRVNQYGGKVLMIWSLPVLIIGIALIVLHFKHPISPSNISMVLLFTLTPLLFLGALPQVFLWAKSNLTSPSQHSRVEEDGVEPSDTEPKAK
ncbi:MAG: SdpI family protein [Verrucomicrobiota bacterium]